MKKEPILKNIFVTILIILFITIIFTPFLIADGFNIINEEILESSMLLILFIISFVIYSFYKKELNKQQKELTETLNYIGSINLQVAQIKSITDLITHYPENKKDFKFLFESLAEKALAGINCDWILFRIIDTDTEQTLTEYTKARGSAILLKTEIHNKDLINNKNPKDCLISSSTQDNFKIKVFGVVPIKKLNETQTILLKSIVNNISMLYLIFSYLNKNKN